MSDHEQSTDWQLSGISMARSCLAAVKAWPKDEVLRWLQAVIDNDAGYLEEVKRKDAKRDS